MLKHFPGLDSVSMVNAVTFIRRMSHGFFIAKAVVAQKEKERESKVIVVEFWSRGGNLTSSLATVRALF